MRNIRRAALAWASSDSTVLVWDWRAAAQANRPRKRGVIFIK
jgi:hypothetical protein